MTERETMFEVGDLVCVNWMGAATVASISQVKPRAYHGSWLKDPLYRLDIRGTSLRPWYAHSELILSDVPEVRATVVR